MKKNLKKVISAVLALTLAMSSFVAMTTSAATFADVADTANYAEAVNALAALGAISGYEDGTFLPDNNITRAEVTTMLVAALNMSADAQASGATTKFADVNEKAKWAAGYVNVGVANGWISGMSATEFAPSDNVTYAQVLSMLTRILGYGDYAVSKGGWPDGYLAAASSAGILSGVSAAANDAMTRAQVARLIWNAVQAPMLEVTTFGVDAMNSEMQKLEGKKGVASSFKTILSDKFDAYVFPAVQVTEITDVDEVTLQLLSTAPWNPKEVDFGDKTQKLEKVAIGETKADAYLFSSAKVIVTWDDVEWKLVYFAPTSRVSTTTVDGSLVKDQVSDATLDGVAADAIRIKKSATTNASNEYKLTTGADAAKYYVNGEEIDTVAGNEAKVQELLKASVGDVVLYEKAGATGRVYDRIMINIYGLTEVAQVTENSAGIKISFPTMTYGTTGLVSSGGSLTVTDDDVADGKKIVTVTKNGAAADLSALAEGDIIAVKYNMKNTLAYATKIEIIATTDTVTGQYTYYDEEEGLYTIGGAMYEAGDAIGTLKPGSTYTFKLDPFGKLYSSQEEATSKNYAIVERYVDKDSGSADYDYLDVVTLDGQSKRLYVDDKSSDDVADVIAVLFLGAGKDKDDLRIDAAFADYRILFASEKDKNIQNRVISYTVRTSTGRVNGAEAVTVESFVGTDKDYNAGANRLHKSLADNAVVLDASKYVATANTDPSASDYRASALSNLTENVMYQGFLVHENDNKQFAYVVLTKTGTLYNAASDFAVAAANASSFTTQDADVDDEVYTLRVMKDGKSETEILKVSQSAKIYVGSSSEDYKDFDTNKIEKGDVFFYTTDADGLVDRIDVVYAGQATLGDYRTNDSVTRIDTSADVVSTSLNGWQVNFVDPTPAPTAEEVELFTAPVVLVNGSSVSFAKNGVEGSAGAYYVDTNVLADYVVASDANIYYYDLSGNVTNYEAFSKGTFTGINLKKTSVETGKVGYAWLNDHTYTVGTGSDAKTVVDTNFDEIMKSAMVMAVDGVITNAIIFGK